MRTADACIAVLGASGIAFHEKFETLGVVKMLTVIGGIAIMLLSKRPGAVPKSPEEIA